MNTCKVDGNPKPEYKVYEKSISLVLKPSEKYMLLVGQLYGRNGNDTKQSTNVVDVVDDTNENNSLNVHDRRKRLLELISANALSISRAGTIETYEANEICSGYLRHSNAIGLCVLIGQKTVDIGEMKCYM